MPTPSVPAPDILRCAYMEIVVTDLAASREFYVDVLDLVVTEGDETTVYLRSMEEFIHHNLVLRQGPVAAVAAFSYRVRSPQELDKAVAFYTELGCRVERREEGFTEGLGDSVRVTDPLGFPYEFFYDVEHVDHVERLAWRYDLCTPGALVRLGHFNQVTPDVPRVAFMQDLGFRVTEDIQDDEGTVYAAWMRRKPTVHDTAMTGGDGPRMHHFAFATHEKHNILAICDKLGALRRSDAIERGPGRHGVSNAFYLYLRDPDGHRVEIYTHAYGSLFVQIESAEAVENAAEIAAVDGVDGVFVGPSDLSASMGLLGQQSHSEVTAAVLRTLKAVKKAGKPVGVNAFDPAVAAAYVDAGVDFLLVGADVTLLARGSEGLAARWAPAEASETTSPESGAGRHPIKAIKCVKPPAADSPFLVPKEQP